MRTLSVSVPDGEYILLWKAHDDSKTEVSNEMSILPR